MKMGNTVLYIPMESLQCSPEEASKDKKLVQRMESKPDELCMSPFLSLSSLCLMLTDLSVQNIVQTVASLSVSQRVFF